RVGRFPLPLNDRIPNFAGAEQAAARLASLPEWRAARTLKCNPDAPQRAVRLRALREGKDVYVAVPRLRAERCFIHLDPRRIPAARLAAAATIGGAAALGVPVAPHELPHVDLVVAGSVAVNRRGARVGKGGGYSDLEFALLTEQKKIAANTPIVTSIHPLQMIDGEIPMTEHDIPLSAIVTPDEVIEIKSKFPRPKGIYWNLLPQEKIADIPVLHKRSG